MDNSSLFIENLKNNKHIPIQSWQNRFAALAGVYVFCLDGSGAPLTLLSAERSEAELLNEEVLTPGNVGRIFDRVTESPIEDQAIEDTDYPNIRIAASALKDSEGKPFMVWVLAASIINRDPIKKNYPKPSLGGLSRNITEYRFLDALDLLRETINGLFSSMVSGQESNFEIEKAQRSELKMMEQFRRQETMTLIVSLLDSDAPIHEIMAKILKLTGAYLEVSNAFLVHMRKTDKRIDITLQWHAEDGEDIFDRTNELERYCFLKENEPYVISSDTRCSQNEHAQLKQLGIKAIAVMPIIIGEGVAFYVCLAETRHERTFRVDDIKFLSDAIRILQSIVTKRNQRNSLAGSYAALESMLDNIGSSIYVRDIRTNGLLFANRSLRNHFSKEIRDGSLQALFESNAPLSSDSGSFEVYHEARERWYELYYTHIKWVDFRPVSLCAIYDITEKKTYQSRIEHQAYTDFLTGLYNRMCFERDLKKQLDETVRTDTKGALMYLDLDDFKHINDTLGHQYGDILLKSISQAMSSVEGLESACYRMGGDEFVAIVRKEHYHRFDKIQEDVKRIFTKPFFLKDSEYYCTMSMGVIEFPTEGTSVSELVQKADIAMYNAKKSGKNRVANYVEDQNDTSIRRLNLEKHMREASFGDYNEFEVYYQPIVSIGKTLVQCKGAEALIRWNSKLGFIPPSEFIPLAEYLGLINPIGNHVLLEACKTCKAWNDGERPDFTINVNLSVVQLLQPDIVQVIKNAIEESGINPSHLVLEVTESLAINDIDLMKTIIRDIKNLGVKLALDDFGTGYSSLKNIRELPFDIIKVDHNFVKDLVENSYSQAFIKMIAELGEALNADICVEGIEMEAQLEVLRKMNVRFAQGYLFSIPLQCEQFEREYIHDSFNNNFEKIGDVSMEEKISRNFIEVEIDKDLKEGNYDHVQTRFPPEPNGRLHIGHAKSILLNYGLANQYKGKFLLRFDDTNPSKEKEEFMDAIKTDVNWLVGGYSEEIMYASDYFGYMYDAAIRLIKKGKAYISTLSVEDMRKYRGTLTETGIDDPDRDRPAEESLKLFESMKNGEVADGDMTLRAKIDMKSPNINMRDPVIYRVAHISHPRTKDEWCIYPMYDFAHPIEDAVEGTTHSICTMEFEDHRPLYDWVIREAAPEASGEWKSKPRQIEFAKMYLTNVVTGKRYIKKLVEDNIVDGWEDPRLVTIAALRRRGFTPESLKMFVELSGISKAQSSSDYALLEYCLREDLKLKTRRVNAVLDPVKLIIDNYEEGKTELFEVENNKENPELGSRKISFSRELYIERDDFMEEPPKKYFRLFPGNEVRLMNAYIVTCTGFEKDDKGRVTTVHCTYDPLTRSGLEGANKKVKGTIHFVDAKTAVDATVRLYENLVDEEKGVYNEEDGSVNVNPDSLIVREHAKLEASLKDAKPGASFQFVRTGYFTVDYKDSAQDHLVFNRIVSLKSSFKLANDK